MNNIENTQTVKDFLEKGKIYFEQMTLENQARMTVGLRESIDALETTLKNASKTSARMACALNCLTAALVVVAVIQVVLLFLKK